MNNKEQLAEWREDWAHLANRHLERHGHEVQIDHRSNAARGIEAEPTKHMGYQVAQMVERGETPDRFLENEEIRQRNAQRSHAGDGMEWTDRAGMVAQQDAALEEAQRRRQQEEEQKREAEKPATIENSRIENSDSRVARLGSDKAREKSDRDEAIAAFIARRREVRQRSQSDDGGEQL